VREADRDVERAHVVVGQLDGLPLAERRRATADVDDDVDDRAPDRADQLGLPGIGLVVHAAHHATPRARVVVLDPVLGRAVFGHHVRSVRLREEAARVAVDGGLEQQEPFQAGGGDLHRARRLAARGPATG
jgi:hypothetical protein